MVKCCADRNVVMLLCSLNYGHCDSTLSIVYRFCYLESLLKCGFFLLKMDHVIDLEGTSMLCTISNLYNELDQHFKDFMDETRESICLLNILKIPATSILTSVVHYFLNFYEDDDNVFSINGQVLCISLEDVHYITGLPIKGSAISNDKNPSLDCFDQVFGIKKTKLSIDELYVIIKKYKWN